MVVERSGVGDTVLVLCRDRHSPSFPFNVFIWAGAVWRHDVSDISRGRKLDSNSHVVACVNGDGTGIFSGPVSRYGRFDKLFSRAKKQIAFVLCIFSLAMTAF